MLTAGPDAVSSPDNGFSYVKNRSLRDLLGRGAAATAQPLQPAKPYSSIGNRPPISHDQPRSQTSADRTPRLETCLR
jgi:hypothetical protein